MNELKLIKLNAENFKAVRGKVKTRAELIAEIQGRCDGTGEKNETQPFKRGVDPITGNPQWAYEIRYGNQVIETFQVQPHILNDEGELDLTDEQIAEFRAAVKAAIPNYAKQIWNQKRAFAVRNRKNAQSKKQALVVSTGGA